jgi:hypothetical protein
VLPIGFTCVLAVYSLQLLQRELKVVRIKQVAMYGWAGAMIASFSTWWLIQHLHWQLPVTALFDEVLTAVSIGSGLGVVLGAYMIRQNNPGAEPEGPHLYTQYSENSPDFTPDRNRLLAETVWTNEPEPSPILSAITTQIAEIEGVDALELNPIYQHVKPGVFADLRSRDDSQWQLLFYTAEYEIRVSSHGTVTIYAADRPAEDTTIFEP